MTYATQQDLTDRFGDAELLELADRDGDGAVDTAVIAAALADADETIDAYVGRRYALPLTTVPAVLTRIATDLARRSLYKDMPTQTVTDSHDAAMKLLRDISTGVAVLDAAGVEAPRDGGVVLADGPDRTFSRTTLNDF